MNYKKIFKVNSLSFILLVVTFIFLYFYYHECQPLFIIGGAILEDGTIGGGLFTPCGSFSQWIWDNEMIYKLYNQINGWYISIISIILTVLINSIIEFFKSRKKKIKKA